MRSKSEFSTTRDLSRHGGELAFRKRKSKRPINVLKSVHLVLKSERAQGKRSLLKHKTIIKQILERYARRFKIKVYENAICGNHIHCLVKAKRRRHLQNFMRVFSGQVAQQILNRVPLEPMEGKAFWGGTHRKNQKSFWSELAFTRIVSYGWDFFHVKWYIVRNVLETMGVIPYRSYSTLAISRIFSDFS